MVSFCFDDFPRSAYISGGSILKSYRAVGTYYVSMGLAGTVNHQGEHFLADDVRNLLAEGHELGSHTYSHVSCRSSSWEEFFKDARKGEDAVREYRGEPGSGNFAYPKGEITFAAKGRMGSVMKSCRSVQPGIMAQFADLNMLRANSLYSRSFDRASLESLVAQTLKLGGWLIFYTHDVRENPSAYGCTPQELEFVVQLVARQKVIQMLSVSQALEAAARQP
jgi:peptidoglycan/xylan/chitin deacetylase (PgdA/CDA1 family)